MTDTTSKLRAAVIGVGVGRSHAKGYQSSPDAELVAACDSDPVRLAQFGEEFGIPPAGLFTDYQTLLADIHPDIVSVCLPNFLHRAITVSALESGAHVICEKPMAIQVSDAEQMIAAAEKAGRKLAICYNHRYHADGLWVKQAVSDGLLGEIYHVDAAWRRETGIPGRGWFGNKALSGGGALIDLGVHVLDMALWFMGFPDVLTVSGATRTKFGPDGLKTWGRVPGAVVDPPFDVDDGATGFLRLGNGADMVLRATWAEHREPLDDLVRIELQGTKGTLVLNIPNYKHEHTLTLYSEIGGEPATSRPVPRAIAQQGHTAFVHLTAKALRNSTALPSDGAQGLAAVRVLEALYKSAASGHEIALT
jgi:predicted dehydrogenase